MSSDPLLIFLHVPKTAGSTLNSNLRRQYSPEALYVTWDTPVPQNVVTRFLACPAEERERVQVFSGHFYYGVQDLLPQPSSQFTMLRDPVEREVSGFYFVRRQTETAMHQLYKNKVSEKFVMCEYFRSGFHPDLDNLQTRLLAGLGDRQEPVPFGGCSEDMLARAIHHMETGFSLVGITEQYDASILLLKKLYGWRMPFYVRQNVTLPHHYEALDAETLEAARANTQYDRRLYAHAVQMFEDVKAKQGRSFPAEVRRFRQLNRLWSIAYHVWNGRHTLSRRQKSPGNGQ